MIKGFLFSIYLAVASLFGFQVDQPANIGAGTVAQIHQGGTGTSTIPADGQMLIGKNGKYVLIASSTLGGGGTGSLTPWTSDIDAASYNLNNLGTSSQNNIKARTSAGLNIYSNNGTQIVNMGAGGGANVSFQNGGSFANYLRVGGSAHGDSMLESKALTNDGSTGIFHGYNASGSEVFALNSDGDIDIGSWKASPIGINYIATSTNSGYVLQSNGNNAQWVSTSSLGISGGSGSGATTTINGISGPNFTFATSSDTNIGISIVPSGSTFTYTMNWLGTLADARINSSGNWNAAYTDRLKWDGGSTGLVAATGRQSLGLTDTATLASSTWYLSTNPAGYITSSSLSPYLLIASSSWGATTTSNIFYTGGNVSIGTSSNIQKLDIAGGLSVNGSLTGTNLPSGMYMDVTSGVGRIVSTGGASATTQGKISFNVSATDASLFSTAMFIDSTANVGIGTTSPSEKLQIQGGLYLTGALKDSTNATGSLASILQSTGTSTKWTPLFEDTKEPTGVSNRASSSISFSTSTRVFSITGSSYDIYYRGQKSVKTTATTSIANTTGNHFIYFDPNGVLTESTTAWDISASNLVPLAVVYWNATTSSAYLSDERHGITMDGITHNYLHQTIGTRYQSGFSLSIDNNRATTTAGIIWDEDLQHSWPQVNKFQVFNRNSSQQWDMTTTQNAYYRTSGTTLLYDNNGASTTVPVANYVAYWVIAGNSSSSPVFTVMGQRVDTTLNNARANNTYSSLVLTNLPAQEFKVLYRVIMQNVAGTATYIENQDQRAVSTISGSGTASLDHGTLSGLLDDDHTQYLLVDGSRAQSTLTVSGTSSFATTSIGTTSTTGLLNVGGYILTNALKVIGNVIAEFFGGIRNYAGYYDSSNATGTSGMLLSSTGTSTLWVATSSLGISGGGTTPKTGIISLNSTATNTISCGFQPSYVNFEGFGNGATSANNSSAFGYNNSDGTKSTVPIYWGQNFSPAIDTTTALKLGSANNNYISIVAANFTSTGFDLVSTLVTTGNVTILVKWTCYK